MVALISRDVQAACKRRIAGNEHNCSGFVRSVANDLMIFLPGAAGDANSQTNFMKLVGKTAGIFSSLSDGLAGEQRAVDAALAGSFVVCGLTSDELNQEPSRQRENKTEKNGHVAVVVGGRSVQGWPIAWWGHLHGSPGLGESLSRCFRKGDRSSIHYFEYKL